jgi:hypothetical protein
MHARDETMVAIKGMNLQRMRVDVHDGAEILHHVIEMPPASSVG